MGFASSQTPSESPKQTSLSPDKKWEFSPGQEAILNKAGTGETVVKFSDDCESGALSENPKLQWAPDSRRFAFYACGGGKEHLTLLYQLGDEGWKALKTLGDDDELSKRASDNIDAQTKKKGLPNKTFLHMQWWTVEPRQWIDSSTLVVHASMAEQVHRRNGEYVGIGFGADLLFTLKIDAAGNWKIVKTYQMTGRAAESPSLSSPLADEVLYRSSQDSYHIQASADGAALWIVPAKNRGQRKPLRGADPDNRSPEEFSGSPDETWLFDNRQHELYRNAGDFAFSVFNRKQWLWKNALDYASKEFHLNRGDVGGESAGWSSDSARLLIKFDEDTQKQFAYFNIRTKAFEQTPYLRMVNTKLKAEKPYEAFPNAQFVPGKVSEYLVFVEPIDPPASEAILKSRFTSLDQEMNTLREKQLADIAKPGDKSIVEFNRSEDDKYNKARDEAVQVYLPFAPKDERESRKLQFLCELTQKWVNGLKEP